MAAMHSARPSATVDFELHSPSFVDGGEIPRQHTCDGADLSPALEWSHPPGGTRSLALIVEDPDAPGGIWTHWLLYGIPPALERLPEGVPTMESVLGIGIQGLNDFRRVGYGGPSPPRGPAHRYVFELMALDRELSLPSRITRDALRSAIHGYVLGRAKLVGRYQRR